MRRTQDERERAFERDDGGRGCKDRGGSGSHDRRTASGFIFNILDPDAMGFDGEEGIWMEVNRLINTINCNVQMGRRVEYIVIHYVGALGGAEDNCRYYASRYVGGRQRIIFVGHDGEIWQSVEEKGYSMALRCEKLQPSGLQEFQQHRRGAVRP